MSHRGGIEGTPADIATVAEAEGATRESLKMVESCVLLMWQLHEIIRDIVSRLELEDVIDSILRAAIQGLGAFAADPLLKDCATGQWNVFAECNKPFDYTGIVLSLDDYELAISGVLKGGSVIMNDFGSWLGSARYRLLPFETQSEKEFWHGEVSTFLLRIRQGNTLSSGYSNTYTMALRRVPAFSLYTKPSFSNVLTKPM